MVFTYTSKPPCWWTKTKDSVLLAPFVRPPAIAHCSIVICVPRDWLQTTYCLSNWSKDVNSVAPYNTQTINGWVSLASVCEEGGNDSSFISRVAVSSARNYLSLCRCVTFAGFGPFVSNRSRSANCSSLHRSSLFCK